MDLNFVHNFESVGRRIQWRQRTAAACWTFAGVIAAALALAAADRWVGVYHFAARLLLTALHGLAAVVTLRLAASRVTRRKSPLEIALLLERDEPALRSLLASGVEFTSQDPADVTAGSSELRRGVVLRAALASGQIDLSSAATRRVPLGKAIAAAIVALGIAAAVTVWAPHGVGIGVVRLFNPFSQVEWPRQHDLAFVDPPQIVALGGDFRAQLLDRHGAMPANVVVEYRTLDRGRPRFDTQRYAPDGSSLEVIWPNVQGPFEFRARGGDHRSMLWRRVAAAKAPKVDDVHITMHAPEYADWADQEIDEPFRVLEGSTLKLAGRSTEPIAEGQLEAVGQPPAPLVVGEDGKSLSLPRGGWGPKATAEWSFRLTTRDGLTMRWIGPMRIEVTPDVAPEAAIVDPVDELSVLPTGQIELTVEANDDVGLSELALALQKSDSAETVKPIEIELYRRAAPKAEVRQPAPMIVHHTLTLDSVDARPGDQWQVRAVARDLAEHESRSRPPLRVRVVTLEDFLHRVERELARVRAAVERSRNAQRLAHSRVEAWSAEEAANHWPMRDKGLAALAPQRQVAQHLASGQDAALSLLAELLAELRRNRLPADDNLQRLERLHAALDKFAHQRLPSIESLLARLLRELELSSQRRPKSASVTPLAEIEKRQRESLAMLEAALEDLSHGNNLKPGRHEMNELKTEQAALRAAAESPAGSSMQNAAPTAGAAGAEQVSPFDSKGREIAKSTRFDRSAVERLVKDRWGRLPERQRDELLQPLSEEFVPKYAAETEAYFRALAEPRPAEDDEQ
jgi:hypothetical protein